MLIKIFKKVWSIFNYLKFLFLLFYLFCFLDYRGGFAETSNAFVFSLKNFEELAPFVSRVKNDKIKQAIYGSSGSGPVFGQDLFIFQSGKVSNAILGAYYSVPAEVKDKLAILDGHKGTFLPDEVEVFYLGPSR